MNNDVDGTGHVRSLTLTCAELALTATLDLAEISGKLAVPIEYRKGRPQRVYGTNDSKVTNGSVSLYEIEPWPTDRVHLGLHVILLERAGHAEIGRDHV